MLTVSGDNSFVSMIATVISKTELYTIPTTAVQKIMRMAALDGRQRCLQEHELSESLGVFEDDEGLLITG
jgi:hypothetical protein